MTAKLGGRVPANPSPEIDQTVTNTLEGIRSQGMPVLRGVSWLVPADQYDNPGSSPGQSAAIPHRRDGDGQKEQTPLPAGALLRRVGHPLEFSRRIFRCFGHTSCDALKIKIGKTKNPVRRERAGFS